LSAAFPGGLAADAGLLGLAEMFKSKESPVILGWVDQSPFGDTITL
jgi:hypothetical protein